MPWNLYEMFMGNRRQSSKEIVKLAQRGKRDPGSLTHDEIVRICMSVISQAR